MRPRVLAAAEDELLAAMLYYEEQKDGLGQDFFERVSETIIAIGQDPRRFPCYEGKRLSRSFRRAPVNRFPYIIVFQLREEETLIVAVAHSSQEPGYWENRSGR